MTKEELIKKIEKFLETPVEYGKLNKEDMQKAYDIANELFRQKSENEYGDSSIGFFIYDRTKYRNPFNSGFNLVNLRVDNLKDAEKDLETAILNVSIAASELTLARDLVRHFKNKGDENE